MPEEAELTNCNNCGDEVDADELQKCDVCGEDGLCNSCIGEDDHDCDSSIDDDEEDSE